MLVMIAIIVSSIVTYSYVATQSTAVVIGRNIRDHAKAHHIAESGLDLALAAIRDNTSWRTQRPDGTWISNLAIAGGTCTIVGRDGIDANGDGVISTPSEGDGSLSDDASDPLTVVVTGRAGSCSDVIRAVIVPAPDFGEPLKHGFESIVATEQYSIPLIQVATRITISQPGNLTSISVYADSANPSRRIRMGLYSDDDGEPNIRLAQTGAKNVGPGSAHWVTAEIIGDPVPVAAGTYWLAFGMEDFDMHVYADVDGGDSRLLIWDPINLGLTSTWFYNLADFPWAFKAYVTCRTSDYSVDLR